MSSTPETRDPIPETPLRAVLFDLDGVIVDTADAHYRAFVELGAKEGFACTPETFKRIFGLHSSTIFPILYGHPLPEGDWQRLADRKEALFRDLARGTLQALPGVMTLIPALHEAGWRLAIGSSTPRENVEMILGELGLSAYFQALATAEDVTRGKPDPQVFLIAAERLGVTPARCVVVEDAVAGVQAALAGGMVALAVTTTYPREALSAAHHVIDSLEEVCPGCFTALLR